MYLKKLNLQNFRCFENFSIDFHKKLTVIVGANGVGKTSILEGAAIAVSSMFVKMDGLTARGIDRSQAHLQSYSIGSTKDVQPQYPVVINALASVTDQSKTICDQNDRDISWERSMTSSRGQTLFGEAKEITSIGVRYQNAVREGDSNIILPVIAYYGTGRLWDYHKEKQTNVFEKNNRLNGYVDCVGGTANLKLMMRWFMKMTIEKYQNQEIGLGKIPELEAVYSAMEDCYRRITGCDEVKVQYSMSTKELEIAYRDVNGNMMRIPINQLSDGYKGTISLVADIAYRMAVLNPHLLGDICKKTKGIVLIDEVDLHLHPKWQQQVLYDLQGIFPEVQFIVTTHAPAVIGSAKSENLRILSDGRINMVSEQIFGNDANSLFKLMNVDERDPKVAKDRKSVV